MLYNSGISFYFGKWLNIFNLCFWPLKIKLRIKGFTKILAKNCQHCHKSFSWGWKWLTMTEWLSFSSCKSLFIWRVLCCTVRPHLAGRVYFAKFWNTLPESLALSECIPGIYTAGARYHTFQVGERKVKLYIFSLEHSLNCTVIFLQRL